MELILRSEMIKSRQMGKMLLAGSTMFGLRIDDRKRVV